jgi:hypothetical protein
MYGLLQCHWERGNDVAGHIRFPSDQSSEVLSVLRFWHHRDIQSRDASV